MMAEVVSLDLAKNKLCTLVNWRGRVFVSQLAGEVSDAVLPMPTTLSSSHPWTLHPAQVPPPTAGLR